MKLDAVVLDAMLRQSLVTVRSLGSNGIRVGAFDVVGGVPAFKSRWSSASGLLRDFTLNPDDYVDGLLELLDRHAPRALMVAHDGTIEAVRRRRRDLEGRVAIALAPEEALAVAVSKARTLSLAQDLGIGIPASVHVRDVAELRDALSLVGFPAVIKPLTSWVDRGDVRKLLESKIVVDYPEARAATEAALDAGTSILAQEWLPGAREAVWLLYAHGTLWARFAQVAHRMYPLLGGCSVVRESIPLLPEIVDPAQQLIETIGLTGVSEVEFRRDRDGRPKLMEINPRLSASVELAVRAGVDFPLLTYSWAAGDSLKRISKYRLGTRMRWLAGDVWWLKETLRHQGRPDALPTGRAVGSFLADCFRPAGYDYLTLSDPLPMTTATASFLSVNARRALRKARSRSGGRSPWATP